jgi:hypothetical protein
MPRLFDRATYGMGVAELRALPYDEYLRTDHWQRIRRDALEAAGYVCQGCFVRRVRLDVHHVSYARRGAEQPEDVLVLCRDCHGLAHNPRTDLVAWDAIRDVTRSLAGMWSVAPPPRRAPIEPATEEYMDEAEGYMRDRPLPIDSGL